MNASSNQSFTAFVGIDWADKKHDVCIQEANCDRREFAVIPHKVELINEWAQSLVQRLVRLLLWPWSCRKVRLFMHFRNLIVL